MFICTTGNETEPRLKKTHRYYNVNGLYRKQGYYSWKQTWIKIDVNQIFGYV